ncbi:hypothetical protein LPB140_03370 [Sphingorhabdus lutea]|uniref:Uncharacterized protein n=1 Tax=Sphingorhabdus lutea TaxID=1913578 RepID=A0A1L3JAC1_9SPHN|nr:hypothetical protein LPB140_03370 [Sphingorhabdus lutea]
MKLSANGVPDETQELIFRTLKVKYSWTCESVYEDRFRDLFETHGTRSPFYFSFGPIAMQYRQKCTYFGWFKEEPYMTGGQIADKAEFQISMVSQI